MKKIITLIMVAVLMISFAVMVNAATMADVAMFVAKRLAPIGGILSTATHFVLTRYKDGGKVFVNDEEEIDERGSNLCD